MDEKRPFHELSCKSGRSGKSKDEALRAGQLELIRGPDRTAAPYYWATFQLVGDWW